MEYSRDSIVRELRASKLTLFREFPLHRIALFGSHARGDATPASDIDIVVEVDPEIGLGFVTLADRLEGILGKRVDLVSRRAIAPRLWKHIEPELIDA